MEIGFIFDYSKGVLGESQSVDVGGMDSVPSQKRNHDDTLLMVKCGDCDSYMDFCPGAKDDLDGYWKCASCQSKVDEKEVYLKLDEENGMFLEENGLGR